MTPHELSDRIAATQAEVATWTVNPAEWGREELDAAVEVWDRLDRLMTDLSILRREHAVELARRVDDERTSITRDGPVTVHRDIQRAERWDGHAVLGELAAPLIDIVNGELVDAITVEVLRTVLPAVGTGQTSSKWKISGLRKAMQNPERFRQVEYGTAVVVRGPQPSQTRNARPSTEPPSPPYPQQHV